MEYRSPLGYNFKLADSLSRQDKKRDDPGGNAPSCISVDSEESRREFHQFPFENKKKGNRNSYSDRIGNSGNDVKNKWNSPGPRNRQSGNTCSMAISDYYHPSMLEDPWKEFEEK